MEITLFNPLRYARVLTIVARINADAEQYVLLPYPIPRPPRNSIESITTII